MLDCGMALCPIRLSRRVGRTVPVGVGAANERYKCCATQKQVRTEAHRGPAHFAWDHYACESNLQCMKSISCLYLLALYVRSVGLFVSCVGGCRWQQRPAGVMMTRTSTSTSTTTTTSSRRRSRRRRSSSSSSSSEGGGTRYYSNSNLVPRPRRVQVGRTGGACSFAPWVAGCMACRRAPGVWSCAERRPGCRLWMHCYVRTGESQ